MVLRLAALCAQVHFRKRLRKRTTLSCTHTRVYKFLPFVGRPFARLIALTMHSRKHSSFAARALFVERREILRAFRRFSRDSPCRIPMEGPTARSTNCSVLTREIGVERSSCWRLSRLLQIRGFEWTVFEWPFIQESYDACQVVVFRNLKCILKRCSGNYCVLKPNVFYLFL